MVLNLQMSSLQSLYRQAVAGAGKLEAAELALTRSPPRSDPHEYVVCR